MDSNNEEEQEEKFDKCWVCGSLVLKARIEQHHIFGKECKDDKIPLCIICHDIVDRMPLNNIDVFYEFFSNSMQEMNEIFKFEPKKFKWIKLFLLKISKIESWKINYIEKQVKDKLINQDDKGEEVVKV